MFDIKFDEHGKKHLEVAISRLQKKLKNLIEDRKQETIISVRWCRL